MSPVPLHSPERAAALKAFRGRQPETHGGVRGDRQRPARPEGAPSSPEGTGAQHSEPEACESPCYVHAPAGICTVTLDAALTMIRDGRFRSLDIHTDETL